MLLSRPAGGRASAVVPGSLALGPAGRSESEGPLPGLSWLSWLPLPPVMRSGAAAAGDDRPLALRPSQPQGRRLLRLLWRALPCAAGAELPAKCQDSP